MYRTCSHHIATGWVHQGNALDTGSVAALLPIQDGNLRKVQEGAGQLRLVIGWDDNYDMLSMLGPG